MVCEKCSNAKCGDSGCLSMYKIFCFVVGLILIYWVALLKVNGSERKAVYGDPMNRIVFDLKLPFLEACCSWWPISHFILFTVIGYLYPKCDAVAILSGIGWELTEVGVYYAMGADRQGVRKIGSENIEYSSSWWMGSFKDIFMNIGGFYFGKTLNETFSPKCECNKKPN